jgi:CheY-like chemotaxis protein
MLAHLLGRVDWLFPVAQPCSAPTPNELSEIVSIVSIFRTAGTVSHSRRRRLHTRGCDVWRRLATRPESWHGYCGPPLMAKILVIDDYPELREPLAEVLMDAGHDVITASDGSIGLALYAVYHPALVITDLELPGLSGLAVVERLSQEPGLKIIVISGSSLDNLERALQLGAAVTLPKPFHRTQLLAAVRQLVGEQPPLVN